MRVSLKAARVNAEKRQQDAAQHLGVSIDRIKYLEKPEGSERITLKEFLSLCDLYNCTPDDIRLPYKSPISEWGSEESEKEAETLCAN